MEYILIGIIAITGVLLVIRIKKKVDDKSIKVSTSFSEVSQVKDISKKEYELYEPEIHMEMIQDVYSKISTGRKCN